MPVRKPSPSLAAKSLISSSIGNVLEWYEYTLYAYFATVISDLFFPADNR
jgi:MHS family proline/betaine transporter-like MFS transporter